MKASGCIPWRLGFGYPKVWEACGHNQTRETIHMHFEPTPDQQAFIHRAIASGRYRSAEDTLRDAMARWEEDERRLIELLAALDEAENDIGTKHYADYANDTLPQLADELKREARAELTRQRRS